MIKESNKVSNTLTPQMMNSIARILDFPVETYIAHYLHRHGITSANLHPYVSANSNLTNIYSSLRDIERQGILMPRSTSGLSSVKVDELPDLAKIFSSDISNL